MKKITIKRVMLVLCFLFFIVTSGILCAIFLKPQNPIEVKALTVDAQVNVEDCSFGVRKTFDSEIAIEYGGKNIVAQNGVVIYPNGTTYVISDQTFNLNQTGKYTLRYFYNDDTLSLVAETKFDICNNLYAVSVGDKTSVSPITSAQMEGNKPQNLEDEVTINKEDALIVRLEDGNKFTYAKPIDLSNSGSDGLSSIIRFDPKMFAFDGADGRYNFEYWIAKGMKVRLTDCYDSSVYVEVTLTAQQNNTKPPHYAYDGPMTRGSTNTIPNSGLEMPSTAAPNKDRREIFVDGVRGVLYMGNYGAGAGGYQWLRTNTNGIELLFDNEKGRLYSRSTTLGTEQTFIVTDFKNSVYGDLEYQPFTTGEVYLSVEFSDYQTSDAARVDIFSIGTDDGAYLTNADNLEYKDSQKPNIKVDFDATENNFGYVAVGEYFTIPSATAVDVNAFGAVDVAVYKNYESDYKTMVNVENRKFKVEAPDVYYVEYTARDSFENVQTKVIKVYGVKMPNGQKTVHVDIGTRFTSFNAGEEYILPKPILTTLNKPDSLRLLIQLTCENKQNITLADLCGQESIDAFFEKDCSFVPLYAGEYTITYQFADNMMEYVDNAISYTIASTASDVVNFIEKPFIDRYLIKDAEYSFEPINAYRYTTGAPVADNNITAYISFDGGAYTKIENLDKVKILGTRTARLKYACGDSFVESDIAQIVDVNYAQPRKLNLENYFVQQDFEIAEGSPLIFKATKTGGDARMSFANRVGYQNFTLKFMIGSGYSDYTKLNIVLSDPYNKDKKAVISFYNDRGDNLVVSVNGGMEYIVNDSFSSTEEKMITYSGKSKRLSVANCKDIILVDLDFASVTAYLDIECIGFNGTGGVRINSINNQNMSTNTTRDNKQPEFYENYPCRGTYAQRTTVKIYPIAYYDVLSPILNDTMTVKVTDSVGNYLTSVDGVLMNGVENDPNKVYEVTFIEFGEYYVDYACVDLQGNACTTKQIIQIKDVEDPELTFTGNITEGGTVNIAKNTTLTVTYVAQDDTSSETEIECYITVMDMKSHYIYGYHETNQLTFSYAGTFEVKVVCKDAAGNYTEKSFIVVVE